MYTEYWAGDEFCITSDQHFFDAIYTPSTNEMQMALLGNSFPTNVSSELGTARDYFAGRVAHDGDIERPEGPSMLTTVHEDGAAQL